MKLLIITQKVDINDDNLGFFHDWLKKFASLADIKVIANYVGKYELPENAKIYSLGKENGTRKIIKILKYQWLLLKLLPKIDGVFFHMCPEYVLGAGLLMKIFRKKTLLWYTHKSVNWKLKLAEKLVNKIFTASKESFRLPSEKVEVTGHGIDLDKFKIQKSKVKKEIQNAKFKIITVGRIAETKNLHLLIETAEILKSKNFNFNIKIAGAPILESDKKYFEKLKEKIKEKELDGIIEFVGPIPNKDIAEFYQSGDLFANLSDTGSMDKTVLEAMVSGTQILVSNEAFADILPNENKTTKDPEQIVKDIMEITKIKPSPFMRDYVFSKHNLANLISAIVKTY